MLTVYVKYFGKLRDLLNVRSEMFNLEVGSTLSDLLLKEIPVKHSNIGDAWIRTIFVVDKEAESKEAFPLQRKYIVLVNGKSISLGDNLNNGDEIAVLPPFGGG